MLTSSVFKTRRAAPLPAAFLSAAAMSGAGSSFGRLQCPLPRSFKHLLCALYNLLGYAAQLCNLYAVAVVRAAAALFCRNVISSPRFLTAILAVLTPESSFFHFGNFTHKWVAKSRFCAQPFLIVYKFKHRPRYRHTVKK